MARLGYDRYGVQGGDVGAFVAPEMGRQAPGQVVGVHVNALVTFPSGDPAELADLTEAEQQRLARMQHFQEEMMGYSHIQATRPQTLAYAPAPTPRPASWPGSSRSSRSGPTRRPSCPRTPSTATTC